MDNETVYGDLLWNPETVNSWQKVHPDYEQPENSVDTQSDSQFDQFGGEYIRRPANISNKDIRPDTDAEQDTNYSIEQRMAENHTYPSPSDDNFQDAIYVKREFYINKIPHRENMDTYEKIKEYRDNKCSPSLRASESQVLMSNFINPNTPYKGILATWKTGSGKALLSITIAEKFKPMVEKYGNRIHVLVPGPFNKQNFLNEIIKFTGETYMKTYLDKTVVVDEIEQNKMRKAALNTINNYYRVMSYRSFYKKVLGQKIREKVISGDKVKLSNRKTESGEYERDISIDRIDDLDNTLLIVDEAHNITGNEYGDAVMKIIEKSKNLRVVLLSATPMKNLASDIVKLINYLRPLNSPMEKDKIFTSQSNHLMEFKPSGKEYFRKMVRGYISYLNVDPLTFAERIDMGEIPPGLDFTRATRCFMLPFQLSTYKNVIETQDDSLDRTSEAVANFVFPGLPKDKTNNKIEGFYGIDGINEMRMQLKNNSDAICNRLASTILAPYEIKNPSNLIYLTENNKVITGDIFNEKYLRHFSIKFYTALMKINETVYGQRGTGLLFIYSNLVRVGIDVFQEVLQRNGYLEYQEISTNYAIKPDTRCYYCGHPYGTHDHIPIDIPKHDYYPATYISITGKSDENADQIPEEKHRILRNVFNTVENKDGKFIKMVIGSKVMNEGITLKYIKEIHILDVHFTLGKVDQVIGRGIRFCTHYDIITEDNPFPKVEIYKYVISLAGEISTEEELYKKAEQKYKLIKETERILQEEAIDCPLNRAGNVFPEELKRYANCTKPWDVNGKENPCPAICGYMSCDFKCGDRLLNSKYYDPERDIYRKVSKSELDYSTYNNSLASEEIEYAKSKIKEMFRLNNNYVLKDILKYAKNTYPVDKKDMFDDYYVFQALDDLIPVTGNDFNNFHDTVVDKFNRPGYLIYREKNYIFQPFDENEELPMYYRRNYRPAISNKLSLREYINNTAEYKKYKQLHKIDLDDEDQVQIFVSKSYDFDSIQEYYEDRKDYEYVGIIDQSTNKKKIRQTSDIKDEFKIRVKRPSHLVKKRESGVASFKGATCATSKDKEFLLSVAKTIGLNINNSNIRQSICDQIMHKMYAMEKFATSKAGNKLTYLIVPANHPDPVYTFPVNLEDRIKMTLNNIQRETRTAIEPQITTTAYKGEYPDITYVKYKVEFDKDMDKFEKIMEKYGGIKVGPKWVINFE